jgi:hypothetical protein
VGEVSNFPFPITTVQQPIKATIPEWDCTVDITPKVLRTLCAELGVVFPAETPEDSLDLIRGVVEKRREKALEARKSKG